MIAVLLFVLAAATVGAGVAAWSGRWRSWSDRVLYAYAPISVLPAGGIFFLVLGLVQAHVFSARSPIAALALLLAVGGVVIAIWQPAGYGPRWFRERPRVPDLSDPVTAAAVAYGVRKGLGEHSSAAVAERRFAGAERVARWRGNWLSGDPGAPTEARADVRDGHLDLYADGLAFSASDFSDRLRQEAAVLILERAEVRQARVVPRGAGVDGHPRASDATRSAAARLVIDTDQGPYLFEMNFAKRKARQINQVLGGTSAAPADGTPAPAGGPRG
jgi:hypothetical protein